jgi:glycosyl transferase family 25
LGFIKSNINIGELRSTEYINHLNNHGIFVKNMIVINDNNFFDYISDDVFTAFNGDIIMDTYFQFDDIYFTNKEEILRFMEDNKNRHVLKTDNNESYLLSYIYDNLFLSKDKLYDIVIHLRLDDFQDREDYIEYNYLINLFNTIDFSEKKTAIVVQRPNNINDETILNKYLEWFGNNNFKINLESNDTITDFNIMKQCKILICSNSTLSWTAAYLSKDITTCYFPNYCFYKIPRKVYFKKPIFNTLLYDVHKNNKLKVKAIILTVKEYNQREKNIVELKSIFKQIGIEVELFYGVNGKKINRDNKTIDNIVQLSYQDEDSILYNMNKTLNKLMTSGELGCAWSHLIMYKNLLHDNMYDKYLILEDDAILCSDFEYLINILNNIPSESDICHIGESRWYPFNITNKINDFFYENEKRYFNNTTSYVVTKQGANKLLEFAENQIAHRADDLLSNANLSLMDFNFYIPEKYIFKQKEIDSIIQKME